MTAFTGVVLAGGRSLRMGRDKALLMRGGMTLLDRAIGLLRDAGAREVLVSGDRPMHAGIPDLGQRAGPVGGIAAVLPHCGDGTILVVPVDMPALDAAALRPLIDALVAASAAHYTAHPLPWAARVDDRLRSAVERLLRDVPDGPSMRALHAAVDGAELTPPDPSRLRNVNTPTDWEPFAS